MRTTALIIIAIAFLLRTQACVQDPDGLPGTVQGVEIGRYGSGAEADRYRRGAESDRYRRGAEADRYRRGKK